MKSRNILVLSTSFPESDESHCGIFVKRLADALNVVRQEEIVVVAPLMGKRQDLSVPYRVVRVRYLPFKLQQKLHGKGGIPAAIESDKKVVLFLPLLAMALFLSVYWNSRWSKVILANWTLGGAICGLVGFLRRCPVVTVLRGSDVSNIEDRFIARMFLRMTLWFSSRVICVSEEQKQRIIQKFPDWQPKILVIENGIDLPRFTEKSVSPDNFLSLVFVGNVTKNKNLSVVLEALNELKRKGVGFRLNVIGDGPERLKLEERAVNLGLCSVFFHGAVRPDAVPQFLEESFVFINASFSEGRSNSLVEAIGYGCLPIVSRIPANEFVVKHKHSGLLFDPQDASSLVEQLLWVEENRAAAQALASTGRENMVSSSYTWNDCASRYSAVFNEL